MIQKYDSEPKDALAKHAWNLFRTKYEGEPKKMFLHIPCDKTLPAYWVGTVNDDVYVITSLEVKSTFIKLGKN